MKFVKKVMAISMVFLRLTNYAIRHHLFHY